MNITITDVRDEDLITLGFINAEDGDKYLYASLSIYTDHIYLEDFMNGRIGKYQFQADRVYADRREHNGKLFQGAGRGRKSDKSFEDMKDFINQVDMVIRNLKLDDEHQTTCKHGKKYVFSIDTAVGE